MTDIIIYFKNKAKSKKSFSSLQKKKEKKLAAKKDFSVKELSG